MSRNLKLFIFTLFIFSLPFVLGASGFVSLIKFLFIITILVFVHELGHFLAAKSVGARVEKFYIGFNIFGIGWSKKIKDTEYGVGAFPFGGYVKISGVVDENFDDTSVGADYELRTKSVIQKIWVMSAGVIMNFVLAVIFMFCYFKVSGIPTPINQEAVISDVVENSPASDSGIKSGDLIESINNIQVQDWKHMASIINENPNKKILISWKRQGSIYSDSIKIDQGETMVGCCDIITVGRIGVFKELYQKDSSFLESINKSFEFFYDISKNIFCSLLLLITGKLDTDNLMGPVGIASLSGNIDTIGVMVQFISMLSINLGIINLFPFPGLDGGHIIVYLIEGVINRELPIKTKLTIQSFGMVILIAFTIYIVINDIIRLL